MEKTLPHWQSSPRWHTAVLAGLTALVAVEIANKLGDAPLKSRLALFAALLFPVIAVVTGRLKELLLICWVGSLTYNRQYFSFEFITGNLGTQGPYWILSDIFLAALLLEWAYAAVLKKQSSPARGMPFWPWYMPLAAMGLVSLLVATRPDWTFYELIRTLKFCVILWYVRHRFGVVEWWTALVAMGVAMVAQSALALKEVVTGRSGLLGAEVTTSLGGFEDVFSQENFYGMVRGIGTMNHPPNLACYLILLIPVFLGLSLTLRPRRLRVGAAAVFLAGCIGLGCTMSRLPWVLAVVEAVLLLVALVALMDISWRLALGLTFTTIVALIMVMIPLRDKIMDRLTRDFTASVDQREEGNRVAFAMIEESPWLGVGLNNSKEHMLKYIPEMAWAFENEDFLTRTMHSRSIAAMGNGYLFVAVELGIVGSFAYAIYLIGTFVAGFRSIARTSGAPRAACLGLVLGTAGMLVEQFIDFSVWVDPLLYTGALVVAMLSLAPTLFGARNGLGGA